jgi:quercetin dioxygenase-like cupin family protein
MSPSYTHISDLAAQAEPPAQGILSRTIHNDEQLKAVVFGFDEGHELTEHTASKPAILQIIRGEATLTLGDDMIEVRAGTWVHMPAGLRHAVKAQTPAVMLLLLLKS